MSTEKVQDVRIPMTEIGTVSDMLFDEDSLLNGKGVARHLGVNYYTFWAWLRRRALPTDTAHQLADTFDALAGRLRDQARVLRRESFNAKRAAANDRG